MNPNKIKIAIGVLAALTGLFVGFTCLMTIGGLSMCALAVTKGMVATYLGVLVPIGALFGFCVPRVWWVSPLFVAFALVITAVEVFHNEPERFGAMLALASGLFVSSFVGSRLGKTTEGKPIQRATDNDGAAPHRV